LHQLSVFSNIVIADAESNTKQRIKKIKTC